MAKKSTAHRPSQANQEYVTTKDGRKVKNTAYKPRQSTSSSQAALAGDISGEVASSNQNSASGDLNRAEAMLENLDSVVEVVESGSTISAQQARELANFVEAIGNVEKNEDLTNLLQSYGIDSVEYKGNTRDSLAGGQIQEQAVRIVSDDPNIPTSIFKTTHGKNRYQDYESSMTNLAFRGDSPSGYAHISISTSTADDDVVIATRIVGQEKDERQHMFENGDVARSDDFVYREHVMQPGSNNDIKLSMWRDKDPNTFDKIENVQTVHDAGMAQGKPVTYTYNDDETSIVASWEEDGTTMYSEYELVGKGNKQRAVPGQKRAAK